jgi:hypothetical protein
MSHYASDIDALRHLISQALPTLMQAVAVVTCIVGISLYFS